LDNLQIIFLQGEKGERMEGRAERRERGKGEEEGGGRERRE
jgi:hypothetical protein